MSMLPPGGGRNSVDTRFLSHVNTVVMHDPSEDTKITIYSMMLKGHTDK